MNGYTIPFKERLIFACQKRDDEWGEEVRRRVTNCNDLVAVEARYHISCNERFLGKHSTFKSPSGRPTDSDCLENFELVCEWLEAEGELCSLSEVHDKMTEIAKLNESENVYSQKWLKTKLQQKYKEHIFFAEVNGKSNVICFREMANYLVTDAWYNARKENPTEEAERIIETAAKLILNDIRSANFDVKTYPNLGKIESVEDESNYLPPYLRLFMQGLSKKSLKEISIGQAIIHMVRGRSSIPPILFGLAVELDHVFGSKWLITELSRLGFCLGWEEVARYKQSVVENKNVANYLSEYLPGAFTRWSADNIDHNIRTLDGKGTFHAMGLVSSTTGTSENVEFNNAHRVKHQSLKRVNDVVKGRGIEITHYIPPEVSGLSKIVFKPCVQLMLPLVLPPDTTLDLLWHTTFFFTADNLRPSWSGYMANVCSGDYPGKSTVNVLPIIDLDPYDMSCIYSTLLFVIDQSKQLRIEVPVLTFDQPLWHKATEIANAMSLSIVLILGGFHLMMSYVGSLGFVMKGSGLQEALETIYGSNTVKHMFTGKATARALRGHFLTESALQTKLLRSLLPAHLMPCINESNDAEDVPKEKIGPNEEYVHQDRQHENQRPMLDDKRYSFQICKRTS